MRKHDEVVSLVCLERVLFLLIDPGLAQKLRPTSNGFADGSPVGQSGPGEVDETMLPGSSSANVPREVTAKKGSPKKKSKSKRSSKGMRRSKSMDMDMSMSLYFM